MKRFYSIFMVAAAVATVFSCSKAENVEPSQPEKTPIVIKGYTDANVTSGHKSSLDGVSVLWNTNDQVAAFDAAGTKVATSSSTTVSSDQKTAEFAFADYENPNFASLLYPAEAAGDQVGTITIPTEQAATPNSFANGANVAFAKVENGDIKSAQFKNLGGLLSIKINNDNIVSVELSAKEVMTGAGTLNTENLAATPATNGENRVLLNGGLDNGTAYYAVVYPGSYTNLKIVITDNQGRTATYTNSRTLSVSRNANLSIATLTVPDDKWVSPVIEYSLVTNAAELTVGSEVIIAAAEDDFALSTTQASNNRTAVAQEKNQDKSKIVGPDSNVQILTIAAGTTSGTVAFFTGEGYLQAASSSNNYLRTETTLSANSSWIVSMDEGITSVVAQGENTRNVMQYNTSSKIFACYGSASQKAIAIYKRSTPDTRKDVTLSFATASFELSIGTDDYTNFSGQTATATPSVSGITYSLNGAAIGTVDETSGVVTLNGSTAGKATITASFAGDDNYKPATAVSYTITVNDPRYVTLDWSYPEEGESATSAGISAIDGVTAYGLGGDYAAGNAPYLIKLDDTGDYFQIKTDSSIGEVSVMYKMIGGATTSKLTIKESVDGDNWNDVEELTIAGSQSSTGTLTTSNVFDSDSRYVKIVFTKGSNVGIGGLAITKADSTPRFTVESPVEARAAAGTYTVNITRKYFTEAISVVIPQDCNWITANDVAANATSFSINVSANTGNARSTTLTLSAPGVTSQSLVVNQEGTEPGTETRPYTVSEAIAAASKLEEGGQSSKEVYISGIISTVDSYSTNYKSITYYISDNGTTTNEFEVFSGKGLDGADFSAITDLAVGDAVTIKGYLKNYNGTLEVNQSSMIVDITYATRYTITYSNDGKGSVSGPTSVGAQGLVTVKITPNSGYELDVLTVGGTDVTTDVASNEYTFSMPANNVTVAVTFKVKTSTGGTASFAPSNFAGQGTSSSGSAISATVDGITFACNKGYGTTQIRCYSGGKITISAASGKITAISFTFSGSYTGGLETSYTGLDTVSWEKSLSSQARITAISVTYE